MPMALLDCLFWQKLLLEYCRSLVQVDCGNGREMYSGFYSWHFTHLDLSASYYTHPPTLHMCPFRQLASTLDHGPVVDDLA
jgi:hypothetical protein